MDRRGSHGSFDLRLVVSSAGISGNRGGAHRSGRKSDNAIPRTSTQPEATSSDQPQRKRRTTGTRSGQPQRERSISHQPRTAPVQDKEHNGSHGWRPTLSRWSLVEEKIHGKSVAGALPFPGGGLLGQLDPLPTWRHGTVWSSVRTGERRLFGQTYQARQEEAWIHMSLLILFVSPTWLTRSRQRSAE